MVTIQQGDKVQWTVNGADQFVDPKIVMWVSDCGGYCGVEGSGTGLPVDQVTVVVPAREATLHENKATLKAVATGTEQARRWEFAESPDHPEVELHVESIEIRAKPSRWTGTSFAPPPEEKFTFFWHGPFSQWRKCRFVVDGVVFNCAEQYMMAGKARMFQDFNALEKIMAATDPSIQKRVGRAVRGFDEGKWNTVAKEIVYKGNHAKFTQNPTLLKALLLTKGTTLVEASPYDTIWGIGLHAKDAHSLRRETWQGKNWLGEVLTRLREDLAKK